MSVIERRKQHQRPHYSHIPIKPFTTLLAARRLEQNDPKSESKKSNKDMLSKPQRCIQWKTKNIYNNHALTSHSRKYKSLKTYEKIKE